MSVKYREEIIGGQRLVLADCLEYLPTINGLDCFLTDPFYGVNGGKGGQARDHGKAKYEQAFEDTPEEVLRVAVAAVSTCMRICQRGAVTPGSKCFQLYPQAADIGCFWSPSTPAVGPWGFTSFHPILYYGRDYRAGIGAWPTGKQLVPDREKNGHPCPKPIGAWSWLLQKVSQEGETVLDPFMGSGTTLVACEQLGRSGIGIEISPTYFDIACKRVEKAALQPRLQLVEQTPVPKTQTLVFSGDQ